MVCTPLHHFISNQNIVRHMYRFCGSTNWKFEHWRKALTKRSSDKETFHGAPKCIISSLLSGSFTYRRRFSSWRPTINVRINANKSISHTIDQRTPNSTTCFIRPSWLDFLWINCSIKISHEKWRDSRPDEHLNSHLISTI